MIKVFLYTDRPSKSFSVDKLKAFLLGGFDFQVINRGDFFNYLRLDKRELHDLDGYIKTIKIKDLERPLDDLISKEDIDSGADLDIREDFIDGYWFQRRLFSYMFKNPLVDLSDRHLHLIITGRLFGTYENKRYHARVLLTGEPSLISTSGIVEAPARPREYYFVKANLLGMGKKTDKLDEIYKDRFIDYDDHRMTEIVCSYALQQIKNRIDGIPFCENTSCCLYNSHWQEEVLGLQCKNVVCDRCSRSLRNER